MKLETQKNSQVVQKILSGWQPAFQNFSELIGENTCAGGGLGLIIFDFTGKKRKRSYCRFFCLYPAMWILFNTPDD
ncbi:MAG TPA: hypothetical protein ENK33_00245 [Desulfobacterales bacterium]|nr:hypothetical protein [Desulfobacterales bacterium]